MKTTSLWAIYYARRSRNTNTVYDITYAYMRGGATWRMLTDNGRYGVVCRWPLPLHGRQWWLGGVVVRMLDMWLSVMTLPGYFWDRWPYFLSELSWDTTTTQVNLALGSLNRVPASARVKAGSHRCRVAGNTVWSHMAYDSGEVISINCYIHFTSLLLYSQPVQYFSSCLPPLV